MGPGAAAASKRAAIFFPKYLILKLAFLIGVQSHNWRRELKGKPLKTAALIFQFSLCKKDQLTSKDSKQALVQLFRAVTVTVTTASPAVVGCHRGCLLPPAVVHVTSHTL